MSTPRSFTSRLGHVCARYLALKQALGRRYAAERDVLVDLDRFLATLPSPRSDLTPQTFALWCSAFAHLTPGVRRQRMRIVRNLCLYRQRTEPHCFVPDLNLFPRPHTHQPPYCLTAEEIVRLLEETGKLGATPTSPLRREVYRIAIVLLYTAGLRRRELVRLTWPTTAPRKLHSRFGPASSTNPDLCLSHPTPRARWISISKLAEYSRPHQPLRCCVTGKAACGPIREPGLLRA